MTSIAAPSPPALRKTQSSPDGRFRFSRDEIRVLLRAQGKAQQDLFDRATAERKRVFGRSVVIRGLIELTNVCRVNCLFCPMRRENTRSNNTFRLTAAQILDSAREIRASGINVVFMQAGENPETTETAGRVIPMIRDLFDDDVEILLNLGNKSANDYAWLKQQGADSYILKHETSDPELNERLRNSPFQQRLDCLTRLIELDYRTGTGTIIGLPDQSDDSIVEDLLLGARLGVDMISASPFIPAPDTPLENHPPGDVDRTLNFIATARLLRPDWLIPSVSALEKNRSGGQAGGLAAGANVLTINFTPQRERNNYLIYGKHRYVVKLDHVHQILNAAGLEFGRSVFA